MSDLTTLLLTGLAGLLVAAGLVLWRVWPVLVGRARTWEDRDVRLEKWNGHLLPLLRKSLRGKAAVARVGDFQSAESGRKHSIATWGLTKTVIPDVEYVAIARPGTERGADLLAVAEAPRLREILGLDAHRQELWGHTAWLYVWPADVDLDAVVAMLTPIEDFRRRHGWAPAGSKGGEPGPAADRPEEP